jgi:perosamine synthetase
MYTIFVEEDNFGMGSRRLLRTLDSQNIQSRPLWQPIHQSPAHASIDKIIMPVAEQLAQRGLSIPCSVGLSEAEQDTVIAAIVDSKR